jgi:hypothetical protein
VNVVINNGLSMAVTSNAINVPNVITYGLKVLQHSIKLKKSKRFQRLVSLIKGANQWNVAHVINKI